MFEASEKLTAPLVAIIALQDQAQEVDLTDIIAMKNELRASNCQRSEEQANVNYSQLSPKLKHHVDLAKERGASSWLSVLLNTRGSSGMPYAYGMAGPLQTHLGCATAAKPSTLIMQWSATWGDFLQSAIMR